MKTRYSATTGSFYPYSKDYGDDLPADLVEVDESVFIAAMNRPMDSTFSINEAGEISIIEAPPLSLEDVKASKIAEISAQMSQRIAFLKSGYPDEEVQTWTEQKSEALGYKADNKYSTPLLSAMAAARGVKIDDLVSRVITNANAWSSLAGAIIGKRQAYEDQINAAKDLASVASIMWDN